MIKLEKMEAFSIVVRLVEINENKMANELMKIITKSIEEDKVHKRFSQYIEVTDKKDEKTLANLLKQMKIHVWISMLLKNNGIKVGRFY